jgi:hypothetical protein
MCAPCSLWLQRDEEIMLDFATCSVAFRLLRMNGYGVSPGTSYANHKISALLSLSSFIDFISVILNLRSAIACGRIL